MLTKKKFRFSLFDFFLYIFMIIVVLLILLPMIHMPVSYTHLAFFTVVQSGALGADGDFTAIYDQVLDAAQYAVEMCIRDRQ